MPIMPQLVLKAAVKKNDNMLKEKALPLTDRELSILSVAVTMLQKKGADPYEQTLVIQVDQNLELLEEY